jgi:uncharacterized protein YbcI
MPERELSPEDQEELRLADVVEKDVADRRQRIYEKYGMKGPSDIATKIKNENDLSTLFERLSPAERVQLREEDPAEWQRILAAHREGGMRKLGL